SRTRAPSTGAPARPCSPSIRGAISDRTTRTSPRRRLILRVVEPTADSSHDLASRIHRLSSVGASQIRSIELPSSTCAAPTAYLSAPVQVDADGVALGAFQPGSSIDLVALLGGGVSSVRLEFDPTSEGYPSLPLRVG